MDAPDKIKALAEKAGVKAKQTRLQKWHHIQKHHPELAKNMRDDRDFARLVIDAHEDMGLDFVKVKFFGKEYEVKV